MSDLLPCPFCGCAMSVRSNSIRGEYRPKGDHDNNCAFYGNDLIFPETDHGMRALLSVWNSRAPAQHPAAAPENVQIGILRDVLSVLRGYPDFDSPDNGFGLMIDEALAGKVPHLLHCIDSLGQGEKPIEHSRFGSPEIQAMIVSNLTKAAAPVSGDVALPDMPFGLASADQLRTYGQQCSDAALERAAKVCEEIAQDHWDQYKGRGKYAPNNPRRADTHADGCSDGANQCADAIRALKGGE